MATSKAGAKPPSPSIELPEEPPPPLEPSYLPPVSVPEGPPPETSEFPVIEMPKNVPISIPVDYGT